MKSTFLPFFHFKEFSADQFSKSTALSVKYVFTTYMMIKRYSKHFCTMYIPSLHFRHYLWQRANNLWTVSTNLLTVSTWKLHFILWKLVRWSNISPRIMPQMPGDACKKKKPFNFNKKPWEEHSLQIEEEKGKALTQESQRQIEDPKTPKKEGREGGKLSRPPLICKEFSC